MQSKALSVMRLVMIGLLLSVMAPGIPAADTRVNHDLSVTLFPDRAALEGRDQMRIHRPPDGPIHLFLAPHAHIREILLNGGKRPYTFDQGRLSLNLEQQDTDSVVDLIVDYACRFDDPAPERPLNTDNPGMGVSGTISAGGTFLLSGAGWYPRMVAARETVDLMVDGPAGTVAVTSGKRLDITHGTNRSVSRWRIERPLEGLSLSAGPYVVEDKMQGGFIASTYLFPEDQTLSPLYLEASLHYLEFYSGRFGDYPFEGFSVVENFFPTGYGFPGYTLLGETVLRLPFIPQTSLPHEIVHNWWGNGVLVDAASGNWCEGLATYSADYLIKEQQSPEAAMDYRRQALRNFASLVSEAADFPLSRFQGRIDSATKAVGYDKAAMVFHMLRREIGDTAFWSALRTFYAQFLFKPASWKNLQQVFENQTGHSLARFFDQWIDRPGAVQLRLDNVRRTRQTGGGYRTTGDLVQEKPYYDVTLELALETAVGSMRRSVRLSGREKPFEIASQDEPQAIVVDPDHHLFRRLSADELPATINTLRGSSSLVIVVSDRLGQIGNPIAERLAQAMGIEPVRIIEEARFSATDSPEVDLLLVGLPNQKSLMGVFPSELEVDAKAFQLAGQRFDQPADVLFCVARRPDADKVVALLHAPSMEAMDAVIVKLPHYGRYSYLAFRDGRNRAKGTWEVQQSPLMVRWVPAGRSNRGTSP